MKTKLTFLGLLILVSFIATSQTKSDEWHLTANSRTNYFGVTMVNGQINMLFFICINLIINA